MFVNRTYKDIYSNVIKRLTNETSITQASTPGSKSKILSSVICEELGNVYSAIDVSMMSCFVSLATGQFLDLFGELYNTPRIQPKGAEIDSSHKMFKFYVSEGTFGAINRDAGGVPQSFVIPQGTEIYSARTGTTRITYSTTEDVTCDKDDSMVWVSVASAGVGSNYKAGQNTLRFHSFSSYTFEGRNSLKVTNTAAVSTPSDYELDDSYRYRIIKKATAGEAANSIAVRVALLSLPGVSDVTVEWYAMGIGTFIVYIKPIMLSAGGDLIAECNQVIFQAQAVGCYGKALYAKRRGVEMEISVRFEPASTSLEKTSILNQIKLNVLDYLSNLDQGAEFVVNEVVQRVMETDERILDIGTANQPLDKVWVWRDNLVEDGRYRSNLKGNYKAQFDEIVVYETSIDEPIRTRSQ